MKNLIEQLEKRFEKVTSKTCDKIIAKLKKTEDEFWDDDIRSDT